MSDIGQLKQRLQDEGVPESWYFIVGVDDPNRNGPRDAGEIVLDHSADRSDWYTYSYERGERHNERHYRSEAEACELVWEELSSSHQQPVYEQTLEERERAREINRRKAAEFEELLRNRGTRS